MGIPTVRVKLLAYAIGAACGGMAGTFLGSFFGTVNADQFEFSFSIFVLAMIILGGLGSIWGVTLGAIALSFINNRLIPDVLNDVPSKIGLDFDLTAARLRHLRLPARDHDGAPTAGPDTRETPPGGVRRRARRERRPDRGDARMSTTGRTGRAGPAQRVGPAVLETRYLSKIFGGLTAVDGVSFRVPEKSIVSIIGPNGAGKTTFFNMLTGLYRPSLGNVIFDGKDVTTKRPDQITALGVARTFQNIRLFGTMSAVENVLVGQHARLKATVAGSIFRTPRVRREEREGVEKAHELLSFCNVAERRHDDAASYLSYGDQRRVEIARALASDPKLLLLDEPTAGMNPQESEALTQFIRKLRDERGLAILLIEHDMKVVMGVSEQVTVLDHGEKIAEGEPQAVRHNPQGRRGLPRKAGLSHGRDARARGRPHLLRVDRGAQGHLAHRRGGRGRHADRLQRRRQVDDAALDLRADAAAQGLDPLPRRGDLHDRRRRRSCGSASRSRRRAGAASSA